MGTLEHKSSKPLSDYLSGLTKLTTTRHTTEELKSCAKVAYQAPMLSFPIKSPYSEYEQIEGNCIVRNERYAMRLRLKDDAIYRQFYLFDIHMALNRLKLEGVIKEALPSIKTVFDNIYQSEAAFKKYTLEKFTQEYGFLFHGLTRDEKFTLPEKPEKLPERKSSYALRSTHVLFGTPDKTPSPTFTSISPTAMDTSLTP